MPSDEADETVDKPDGTDSCRINRRRYLALSGSALAAAAGGLTSTAAAETRDGIQFDRVVNAVEDLGMDPNGNERIDETLTSELTDGTLIVFPEGEYLLGSVWPSGRRNVGLVAAEGARPTFVAPGHTNQWLRFPNGDNVLLEGFDFDMRGDGVGGTIDFQMDGSWVIRDVRKLGAHPHTEAGFRLAANDPDSTGLAERCVATDGAVEGDYSVGMFVPPAHGGTVTIRDCHIENFSNNGLYASPPGHTDDGAVQVEGGLFRNNNIANIRLGSTGSYARDVTIVNDAAAPSGRGARNQRAFYLRRGGDGIELDGCDVVQSYEGAGMPVTIGGAATGASCSVTDNRIQNNTGSPAIYCNSSVAGGWSGSGNYLTGSGNMDAPAEWVACQGSGCESPTSVPVRSVDPTDGDSGNGDSGAGESETPTETATPHPAPTETETATETETVTETETAADSDLPRTLVVDSSDQNDLTTYSFTVSESVERSGDLGTLDSADSVDGATVSGSTWGGVDGYRFAGEVTDLNYDGPATLLVDGEAVDPDEFGDDPALPNTLVVDSSNVQSLTEYSFTVSESVERSGDLGTLDGADSVDGATATGSTWGGVDGYRFAGEITDLTYDGDAPLYVNGEQVDPASFQEDGAEGGDGDGSDGGSDPLPNRLVVDGSVVDGEATYEIEVSGDLERGDLSEADDEVSEGTVTGTIGNDVDAYRYSGSVVSMSVDGAAAIRFDSSGA